MFEELLSFQVSYAMFFGSYFRAICDCCDLLRIAAQNSFHFPLVANHSINVE